MRTAFALLLNNIGNDQKPMSKNHKTFLLILIFAAQIGYGKSLKDSIDAAYGASLPSDIRFFTLPNGLRCYLAHNAKPERRAEIRLVINAGSLLEDDDQRGLAHVLEHLAFNGSKRFPKQAIVKYLEERGMDFGAHTNAYTSADETLYQMQIPTDSLSVFATALDIVADWSSALTLDSAAIEKERSIVIEEWRMGYLGLQGRINHAFTSTFYGNSRYHQRLPIGTKSSLDTFKHEALRRFYRDWYVPKNMALVVVGDIPVDSLERFIRERLSEIPARESVRIVAQERAAMRLLPTSADSLPIVSIIADKEMPSIICETHWRSAVQSITTQDQYKKSLLRGLTLALINNRFAELATASTKPPFRSASVTWSEQSRLLSSASLSLEPSEALFTSYEAALVELRRINRDGFLPSEIARAKAGTQKSMMMAYNERRNIPSSVRVGALVSHALTGSLVIDPEQQYKRDSTTLAQSSPDELRQMATTLFPIGSPQQLTFIAVSPQDSSGITPSSVRTLLHRADTAPIQPYREDSVQKRILSVMPPRGTILRERFYARSGVTEWRLSNGVRVLLKPTPFTNDQILIQSVAEGGLSLAPPQEYLAAKTAIALQAPSVAGVGALTATELGRVLTGKSVAVTPFADRLYHGMTAVCSPSDIETALKLFYAAHTAPRFDSVSSTTAKQRELQSFGNRANAPLTVIQDSINAILYDNHYAVRTPTRTEIQDWNHQQHGFPFFRQLFGNMRGGTVSIVGSFDIKSMKAQILRYIGGLPTKISPLRFRDIGAYPKQVTAAEKTIRKGAEAQAYTFIASTTFLPEWTLKFDITTDIVREIADTKLRETLRNDAGGVYASNVDVDVQTKPRPYVQTSISFPCEPQRVGELATSTAALWERLRADGIQERDVQEAKTKLLAARQTSMNDNNKWLERLQFWTRQGDSPERIFEYVPTLEAINREDVRRAFHLLFGTTNRARFVLLPEKL